VSLGGSASRGDLPRDFDVDFNDMIRYRSYRPGDASEMESLYAREFSEAEGEEEGAMVAGIARALLQDTAEEDLHGYVAADGEDVVGAVLFSRLRFRSDVSAFLLSPMAVDAAVQGQGVGQALIRHGLDDLRSRGVDLVVTYGDPAFYGCVGFKPLDEATVPPPFALSQPEGWLGRSLTGAVVSPVDGPCRCVEAFDDPSVW
jgi:predicted N-acetyltransferase YhbS